MFDALSASLRMSLARKFTAILCLVYIGVAFMVLPVLGLWLFERKKAEMVTADVAKSFALAQAAQQVKGAGLAVDWSQILISHSASRSLSCVTVSDIQLNPLGSWPKSGCIGAGDDTISIPVSEPAVIFKLTYDYSWLTSETLKGLGGVSLILFVLLTALLLVSHIVYKRIVGRPLEAISHIMNARANGARPRFIRGESQDEIGLIRSGYNKMLREEVRKKAQYGRILREKERQDAEEKARSVLVGCVGHHIHTPMNAVQGIVTLMEALPRSKAQDNYLKILKDGARQLSTILQDLLVLAEWRDDNESAIQSLFAFEELSHFIEFDAVHLAGERRCSLFYANQIPAGLQAKGPLVLIRALSSRCTDYTTRNMAGGPLDMVVRMDKDGSESLLVIEWIGGGGVFGADMIIELSDISERLGDPLVLTIEELARSCDGHVHIAHKQTGELMMQLRIPVSLHHQILEQSSSNTETHALPAKESHGLKVLVIDDNQTNLMIIEALLQTLDHDVITAEDWSGVKDAMAGQAFDVVILDLAMPEMDGFEMKTKIMTAQSSLPYFIACSGHNSHIVRKKCADHGFDAFLPKPVDRESIKRMMALAIA